MPKPRAVMDTNVLVAALRSRDGASFELLQLLRAGAWTPVLSNHLVHEYAEKLHEHAATLGIAAADVEAMLNAVSLFAEEWPLNPG